MPAKNGCPYLNFLVRCVQIGTTFFICFLVCCKQPFKIFKYKPVSEPLLRSLFREAFSISPAVYIRNMRLSYARELLLSGEYGVTEAAALAGFNDPSYFSREYKKLLGTPPKDAKK